MWWGWEDGVSDAPNFVVFEDYPTGLAALLRNDGAAYQTLTLTQQPTGGLTVPHTYSTDMATWSGALVCRRHPGTERLDWCA